MGEKIRKIAQWLWLVKERLVLLIMLGIFAYRVYEVLNPPPPPVKPPLRPPVRNMEELPRNLTPPRAPITPAPYLPGTYATLYNRNPFWYYSGPARDNTRDVRTEDLGITLLDIREVSGGRYRARLQIAGVPPKWCDIDEQFQGFQVQEINPDEGTVVVYAEREMRRVTLRKAS